MELCILRSGGWLKEVKVFCPSSWVRVMAGMLDIANGGTRI
jgi:hypothetical protein